ncbi:acyl carrier protein [Cryobacterium levicorallinum]|uniref:Acyl carrier protein n=1 Tax=Cryobacterium levicorallinum TaxID=995038 RepID=A0A1I3E061_9MICO|nr:hypothetical protein [Cryobacterium levicorallinum]TFB81521.1 acyl carrier protein [Cryobacterium levicorallinum]GEP28566.1 hypothetical protein CLE01_31640 [Cryobacterium levicorallinum]SFH92356.1 acyl carrier protein [Cryobacterium levicorallinum]
MEVHDFIHLVEETLEVDAGTVLLTDRLADIDWDSLANISFIAALDMSHNAVVDADALGRCETVQDLFALAGSAIKGE